MSIRFHRAIRFTMSAIAIVAALFAAPGTVAPRADEPGPDGYVCPPCGCSEDGKVSSEPGSCKACSMKRIRQSQIQRVAVLLYEGVQIIDYAAPWEVFGQAGYEIFSVSKTGQPLKTSMGMAVTPAHSFETAPVPTILLVPGGDVRSILQDKAAVDWVRATAGKAKHVLSVCNGAFILAEAGLLENQKATTYYPMMDMLQSAAPGIQVVRDARWVDIGKVITSAGLSSGMDSSIHLVSKISGLAAAQRLALNLEYDWKPEGGYARGALAVNHMPRLNGPAWEGTEMLATAGERDRWETRFRLKGSATPAEVLSRVKSTLDTMRSWTPPSSAAGPAEARWSFEDDEKRSWTGRARVSQDASDAGSLLLVLEVARDGAAQASAAGGSPGR